MNEKLKEIKAHLERVNEILTELIDNEPKAKIEIKISSGNKGQVDDMDELIEKFSKDLEEMLNDTTEKREG